MACGTSASDLEEEIACTIGWESVGSADMARRFITAAELYLALNPEEIQDQYNTLKYNFDHLAAKLRRAYDWLAQSDTTNPNNASTRFFSMENFR